MRLFFDRNGFPELGLDDECRLRVAVFPMTKRQFEIFLAEPSGFGNAWYSEILKLNPRVSSRSFVSGNREGLWLTGVTPQEAMAFLSWLGSGYRLPTAREWHQVARFLDKEPFPRNLLDQIASAAKHPAAREILKGLWQTNQPRSWAEFMLFRGGVLEWLDNPGGPAALGVPRPIFFPNTFDLFGETIQPVGERRLSMFGFRPFRSTPMEAKTLR